MPNYKNYSISAKLAKFYQKEKQPTEGYEEVKYEVGGRKGVTYHKYQDRVQGKPVFFDVKEVDYEGSKLRFLELTLEDGDDHNKISVPLKNKGGYTDDAKNIISILYNADITEPISVSLKTNTYTKKNGKEGSSLNIYGNYLNRKDSEGRGESTGYIPYNDIPKPTSKTVAGDTVWDFTPQTEFFYEKLQEIIQRFKDTPKQAEVVTADGDRDDSLPF